MAYTKVPFELDGNARLRELELTNGAAFRRATTDEIASIMAGALAHSLDIADRAAVEKHGAHDAAVVLLQLADSHFTWRDDWWQLVTVDGEPAGCVMPVLFRKSGRAGSDEGTIFHIGVLPRFRGHGLGRLLLAQATNTLLAHGVWRLYCDTASNNKPMIAAFTSQGWTRHDTQEATFWG